MRFSGTSVPSLIVQLINSLMIAKALAGYIRTYISNNYVKPLERTLEAQTSTDRTRLSPSNTFAFSPTWLS